MFDPHFLRGLFVSLTRLVTDVSLGCFIGVLIGVLVAALPYIRLVSAPFLGFLAVIPVVVWIPFAIMFFGIGEWFKIGLVILSSFFISYIAFHLFPRAAYHDFTLNLFYYTKDHCGLHFARFMFRHHWCN